MLDDAAGDESDIFLNFLSIAFHFIINQLCFQMTPKDFFQGGK